MARTYLAVPRRGEGRGASRPRLTIPLASARRLRSGRSAVAQLALSGLAIVALLGLAGVELLRHAGSAEALRNAKTVTGIAARGVIEPAVTPAVLRGDPRALARLDRIVRASVLKPPIVRVKLWAADGRVVYSDEPRLIGARYSLGADEKAVLARNAVEADVSDLSRPENRFERGQGKLTQVYLAIRAPGGGKLMFEAYQRQSSLSASSRRLWLTFAPALVGGLLLLQLFQLPLARSLARRVRRAGEEREALLRRAVEASDQERRRLASVLHDGVVQELAGVSFGLAAAASNQSEERVPASVASGAAGELRGAVQELRSLLVDLYPGGLHETDLRTALGDVAAQLEREGVHATLELELDRELPHEAEELVYRAAREGARNVVRHAGASNAAIRVSADSRRALLEVEDDGRGVPGPVLGTRDAHFGLALLRDLVAEHGGTLTLGPARSGGALLSVEVPLR